MAQSYRALLHMRVRSETVVLLGAFALAALAGPSLALPLSKPGITSEPVLLRVEGRKGTRNYVPGAATALPDVSTTPPSPQSDAKALADCIAIWDRGTHISKSKWKEICKRQIKDRAAAYGQ